MIFLHRYCFLYFMNEDVRCICFVLQLPVMDMVEILTVFCRPGIIENGV